MIRVFISAIAMVSAATAIAPVQTQAQGIEQPVQLPELDERSLAIAREIISLGFPEETRLTMFNAIAESMAAQMKDTMALFPDDPEMQAIIDDFQSDQLEKSRPILERHISLLMDGTAKSYANIFTYEELLDILDFVKTPAGENFFVKSTDVISDPFTVQANQAYFTELGVLQREGLAEMTALMDAFEAENEPDENPDE